MRQVATTGGLDGTHSRAGLTASVDCRICLASIGVTCPSPGRARLRLGRTFLTNGASGTLYWRFATLRAVETKRTLQGGLRLARAVHTRWTTDGGSLSLWAIRPTSAWLRWSISSGTAIPCAGQQQPELLTCFQIPTPPYIDTVGQKRILCLCLSCLYSTERHRLARMLRWATAVATSVFEETERVFVRSPLLHRPFARTTQRARSFSLLRLHELSPLR